MRLPVPEMLLASVVGSYFKFSPTLTGSGPVLLEQPQYPANTADTKPHAFVLWHGLGDTYDSDGLNNWANDIKEILPGAFVHSIYLDKQDDSKASMFGNANEQVDFVCEQLNGIPELAQGFSAIGALQGGLLLRALIQRCPTAKVSYLIAFGSPQMGILEMPHNAAGRFLERLGRLYRNYFWSDQAQKTIVPAQYFRDPAQYKQYLAHSRFLADVNNERPESRSPIAKERLTALDGMVVVKFANDLMVVPKESAWFQQRDPTSGEPEPLEASAFYREDWVGVRTLAEQNKLEFHELPGTHLQIPRDFFVGLIRRLFAEKA